jgi:hypothetical protein
MKTFRTFLCLSLALILTNCADDITRSDNDECDCYYLTEATDAFVFGKYFGFCQGEQCTNLYKLQNGQLFADDMERLMHPDDLVFQPEPLSEDKYATAKAILDSLPTALFEEPSETIGCPDCADQGGYFIEWRTSGETQRWYLDANKNNLPEYLVSYAQQIDEVLAALK